MKKSKAVAVADALGPEWWVDDAGWPECPRYTLRLYVRYVGRVPLLGWRIPRKRLVATVYDQEVYCKDHSRAAELEEKLRDLGYEVVLN